MRSLHALLRALRTRQDRRTTAGRTDATHPPGTEHPGLADLLEAARAPGTAEELATEQETVAAFVAQRRNAARSARRRRTARIRAALVPVTAGLALLFLTGTAVAARTGNLPQEAQQHAHRLFSALGVPAPRTGAPAPAPSRSGPRPSLDVTVLGWCDAWRGTPAKTLSGEDRRKLSVVAGGEEDIDRYCTDLHRAASGPPQSPATAPSPGEATPSRTPSAPTSSAPDPTPTSTAPPTTPPSSPSTTTATPSPRDGQP